MKITVILLIISSLFWTVETFSADAGTVEKKPVKIAFLVWPGYAHSYIAKEKGFFSKYGVDVELVLKDVNLEVLNLFLNL